MWKPSSYLYLNLFISLSSYPISLDDHESAFFYFIYFYDSFYFSNLFLFPLLLSSALFTFFCIHIQPYNCYSFSIQFINHLPIYLFFSQPISNFFITLNGHQHTQNFRSYLRWLSRSILWNLPLSGLSCPVKSNLYQLIIHNSLLQ